MLEIIKYTICSLLVTLTAILFGFVALGKKPNFKNERLYIGLLCSTILYVAFNYIEVGELKSILTFIVISLLLYYVLQVTIYKSILMSFAQSMIIIFAEVICFFTLKYVIKASNSYIYDVFARSIISNIIVCTIFIALSILIKKQLQKLFAHEISPNVRISIFTVLSCIYILIFFYIGFSNLEMNNALLISIFGMIVFLAELFSLVKQKIDNNKITEKYDSLIEFMNSYEEKIDELRIQGHENKNQLLNIKSKIIDKDKSKNIIEYIDSILNEKVQLDKGKYSKLKYLPSNGFKGMFYYKISKAEKLGVKISVNVSAGIKKSVLHNMNAEDYKQLCRIIGVYLDNAIEASAISNEKLLGIEIYLNNNDVEIIISNSYLGKVDTKNVNEKGYSTKGKNRGYGLPLVKNILEHSDIFSSETITCNDIYTQKLNIKGK